jgi:hypothetical protein
MTAVFGLRRRANWSYVLLLACGVAMTVLYSFFAELRVPAAPNEAVGIMQRFGVIVALLFLFFIGAVLVLGKIIRRKNVAQTSCLQAGMPALPSRALAGSMTLIIGFAILFRLLLLPQTPFLSNDIYRYLWDAEVLQRGINPYLYPPEASELASLQDSAIYEKMSHKHVRTVYPPLLQSLFWLGAKFAAMLALNPIHALKALWILIDLALIGVLAKVLAAYEIDSRWAMLYAWHPLAVIEIASNGHTDGVGAFCLLAALLMLKRERHVASAIFLAFGFLVKFVTALLVPFVFLFSRNADKPQPKGKFPTDRKTQRMRFDQLGSSIRWKKTLFFLLRFNSKEIEEEDKKLNWRFASAFFAVLLLAYLPFISAGENLFSGLSVYSAKWRFNDALFSLIYAPVEKFLPDWLVIKLMIPRSWEMLPETLVTRRIDLALLLVKAAMAVVFGLIYLRMLRNMMRQTHNERVSHWPQLTLGLLAAFFLLSPTFQPWYMLWLLPLLCIAHNADAPQPKRNSSTDGKTQLVTLLNKLGRTLRARFPAYLWALSFTVFLSYWVLHAYWHEGIWQEQSWVKWVEYGLPGVIFLLPIKSHDDESS